MVIFQSYKLKVTLSLESKVVIYTNVQSFTFTNCCLEWIIYKEIYTFYLCLIRSSVFVKLTHFSWVTKMFSISCLKLKNCAIFYREIIRVLKRNTFIINQSQKRQKSLGFKVWTKKLQNSREGNSFLLFVIWVMGQGV